MGGLGAPPPSFGTKPTPFPDARPDSSSRDAGALALALAARRAGECGAQAKGTLPPRFAPHAARRHVMRLRAVRSRQTFSWGDAVPLLFPRHTTRH